MESDAESVRRALASRVAGLYVVTPDTGDTGDLVSKVAAALEGGASVVQYRNKSDHPELRRTQAQALGRIPLMQRGLFIINDDPDLAVALDADGVHIGDDDPATAEARARVGPGRLIGVSCYDDFDRAIIAVGEGADYVAFGSFYPSATKPKARSADVRLLERARGLGVPVVAIGGITAKNAATLIAAGADAVAIVGDVFFHDDPAEVARAAAAVAALFVRSRTDPGERR